MKPFARFPIVDLVTGSTLDRRKVVPGETICNMPEELKRILRWVFGKDLVYVMLPLIASIIVGVAGYQQFRLANWLIAAGLIWLEGHWIFSSFLEEKWNATPWSRAPIKAKIENSKGILAGWIIGVTVLIGLIGFGGFYWVHFMRLNFEQDDVFSKLGVEVRTDGSDAFKTTFTVTNGGSFPISDRHEIGCFIHLAISRGDRSKVWKGISFAQLPNGMFAMSGGSVINNSGLPSFVPIAPGGDSQTDSCLSGFRWKGVGAPFACVDMTVHFAYYLANQPDILKD
ncbi:MAG TPA: hypothetical protein VFC37_11660, partial [Terracidiphilus sp.]|nr:hypothetical protein [Terracidiphilus sp.]